MTIVINTPLKSREMVLPGKGLKYRIIIALATALLTGCASVSLVENTRPIPSVLCHMDVDSQMCTRGTIDYSLAYLDNTYESYRERLIEEIEVTSELNSGMTMFAAIAAGFGIFGGHVDTLKATGLLAATTYQLGSWTIEDGRRGIYLEGMQALQCTKQAVSPITGVLTRFDSIELKRNSLLKAIDEASNASSKLISTLTLVKSGTQNKAMADLGDAGLVEFNAAIKDALNTIGRTSEFESKVAAVAPKLESKIDQIRITIDKALEEKTRDLSDLKVHVQSLHTFVSNFAPQIDINQALQNQLANTTVSTEDSPTDLSLPIAESKTIDNQLMVPVQYMNQITAPQYLANAIGLTQAAVTKLKIRNKSLQDSLYVDENETEKSLQACGLKKAETPPAFKLSSTQVKLKAKQVETYIVSISGGKPPYMSALLNTSHQGITSSTPPGTNVVVISTSLNTTAGQYQIQVGDSNSPQQTATINITVSKPETESTADQSNHEDKIKLTCQDTFSNLWANTFQNEGYVIKGNAKNGIIIEQLRITGGQVSGLLTNVGNYNVEESDKQKLIEDISTKLKNDAILKSIGCNNVVVKDIEISKQLELILAGTSPSCAREKPENLLQCAIKHPISMGDCGAQLTLSFVSYKDEILTLSANPVTAICKDSHIDSFRDLNVLVTKHVRRSMEQVNGASSIRVTEVVLSNNQQLTSRIVEIAKE
jgi:hypothetical protein